MKKILLSALLLAMFSSQAQAWKPAGDRVKTRWAEQLDPQAVGTAYPRPELQRNRWQSLDGLWRYAVTAQDAPAPVRFEGEILVPFAPEASLSGLKRTIAPGSALWYERRLAVPADWRGKQVLLHFGAVAGKAEVWVNGCKAGERCADSGSFSCDITSCLNPDGDQLLRVKVTGGETPVTGIWQTVWMEPVGSKRLTKVCAVLDPGLKTITVKTSGEGFSAGDLVEVSLCDGTKQCASGRAKAGCEVTLTLKNPTLWTPEQPFLYTLRVRLLDGRRLADETESYCALRLLTVGRDAAGRMRFQLNGRDRFLMGVADRGWWPDGLWTAPSDEAAAEDLALARKLGFDLICCGPETISSRRQYLCDRTGLLVLPEMPEALTLRFTDEAVPALGPETAGKLVLAEFGDLELPLHDHIWNPEKNWGYVKYRTCDEVTARYEQYAGALAALIGKGLAAAVCVQLTDFEGDVTGLQTADRKALKVDEERVARANRQLGEMLK